MGEARPDQMTAMQPGSGNRVKTALKQQKGETQNDLALLPGQSYPEVLSRMEYPE